MKTCCYDDHLPYTLWCSCKDLPEVPGLNPGWILFSFYSSLGQLSLHFYSGWSLGVAVLGICMSDFRTIFLLSVSARLKKNL